MQTRAELKQESKNLLKGHWGKAIGLNVLQILPLLFGLLVGVGIITAVILFLAQEPSGSIADDVARGASGGANSNSDGVDFISNILTSLIETLLIVGVNFTLLDWLRTKG